MDRTQQDVGSDDGGWDEWGGDEGSPQASPQRAIPQGDAGLQQGVHQEKMEAERTEQRERKLSSTMPSPFSPIPLPRSTVSGNMESIGISGGAGTLLSPIAGSGGNTNTGTPIVQGKKIVPKSRPKPKPADDMFAVRCLHAALARAPSLSHIYRLTFTYTLLLE